LEERQDDEFMPMGKVRFGGIVKDVSLACIPEAKIGDYVLVHAGIGLSIIDEDEANQVFSYLREMGELDELTDETS
jgi:hydrogenase expression/formation protein HypC